MRHSNFSTALLFFVSALAFSGCRSSHAFPNASSSVASLAKPSAASSSARNFTRPSKRPPRNSEFSVYRSPSYGISFRYPRNYLLQEAAPDPQEQEPDSSGSGVLFTQESLEAEQPGAVLVATIQIPDDAYPNTTFVSGHLQFVVNPHATAESCRALVAPPDSALPAAPHDLFLQDIHFQWRPSGSVSPSVISAGREYAGFSGGACYEFFLQVVSTPSADSAFPTAPADLAKILRPLEKSVASFRIHSVSRPE